jgi:hypothetical protein
LIGEDKYNSTHKTTNDNKRTATMTFRVRRDIMEKLRHNAKIRGISLNMLINQIFKDYADWYMFESKIGMIPLSKPILIELFKDLRKDEVIDIATNIGKIAIYNIAIFMNVKMDIDSFMAWFEARMKNSSIGVSHIVHDKIHSYTIKHDICFNWSLYHKALLEVIFGELYKKEVDIQTSEASFTIHIEK